MLLVQEFIKTNTIGNLYHTHGVEVSFSKCGKLMSLNYSQLKSKETDKLACQCRGLILAKKDGSSIFLDKKANGRQVDEVIFGDSVIVSYGFDRFFNEGQTGAYVNYKDKDIKVYEKLDGTCIFLYFYDGQWGVATRSTPQADILIDDRKDYDFCNLFKKALFDTIGIHFDEYVKTLDKDFTYVYELTTPRNMIVVRHKDYRVTLLAARNKKTLEEHEIESLENLVPKVVSYPLNTIDQIVEFVSSKNGHEHEGVVVRDSKFKRVKVKNPAYSALNRIKDKLGKSKKSILELILLEKEDDAIPYLPDDIVDNLKDIKSKVAKLIERVDQKYIDYIAEVDQYKYSGNVRKKVFAEFVSTREDWQDPFFKIYDGKFKNASSYILSKKQKDGCFPDSFLKILLKAINEYE